MVRAIGFGAGWWLLPGLLLAGEQTWELRAEFLSLASGEPPRVILKLADGTKLEVPLQALSDKARESVRIAAAGSSANPSSEADPLLTEVGAAAADCRSAEEAVLVYRLALAGTGISPATRKQLEKARDAWQERAVRREVRLGKEWVSAEKAKAAERIAAGHIDEVVTMARLGNPRLIRETLEKASRADPASGRADFLLGLGAMMGVGQRPDAAKAGEAFAAVVAREPDNGMAYNNMALCDVAGGRLNEAINHFEAAAERLGDLQVVAANVAAVIGGMGGARTKLSNKQIEALTGLYRRLAPDQSGQQPPPPAGPTFLSPLGLPITQSTTFADVCVPPAGGIIERPGPGIVVAPNVVLVPATLPFRGGTLSVRSPDGVSGELPAAEIATSRALGLTLLRCEGLSAQPLALAEKLADGTTTLVAGLPPGRGAPGAELDEPGVVLAADVMPGVFVHTAAKPGHPVAMPLADLSGRVVGLTMSTPRIERVQPRTNVRIPLFEPPRAFGRSIDQVWPFLQDHLPELRPQADDEPQPSWDAVTADLSRGVVTVVSRSAAGGGP